MEMFLEDILKRLKSLRKTINNDEAIFVSKKIYTTEAHSISLLWFDEVSSKLENENILSEDLVQTYGDHFKRLLHLSSGKNRKKAYQDIFKKIITPFNKELLIPVKTTIKPQKTTFNNIIQSLQDKEEDDYVKEAIACANANLLRAAVVMGWCATVNRIHKKIEQLEFVKFNVMSASLASKIKGRFKRFNKTFNVNSINEIREVFDTDILWIIEGMELIDSNQHTRLKSCFDMRCHSSHPGEAPITEYNLMSFFSDIDQIVLSNNKFSL
ncbi:MAG: hypothetical protein ACUZ8I_06715 [Candidatus Scalindua sp.]